MNSVEDQLRQGLFCHQSGQLKQAEGIYLSILRADQNVPDALHLLGVLMAQTNRMKDGVTLVDRARTLVPENAEYQFNYGHMMHALANPNEAREAYEEVLRLNPAHVGAKMNLGALMQSAEMPGDALRLYDEVLEDNPGMLEAQFNRATALKKMGRRDDARTAFVEVADAHPEAIEPVYNIADLELEEGNSEAGLQACERALAIEPDNAVCLGYQSVALQQLKRGDALNDLIGYDDFVVAEQIPVPDEYESLEALNKALEDHIVNHPSLRYAPPLQATRNGLHTGSMLEEPKGPFEAFEKVIRAQLQNYVDTLADVPGHPMCLRPPEEWRLDVWAVVMEEQGHQLAHIHGDGYLSGVYYCRVPDAIGDESDDKQGWIEFGRPPENYPIDGEPEVRFYKPEEGLMVLFPSYLYHRTVPFVAETHRISIAFDMIRV